MAALALGAGVAACGSSANAGTSGSSGSATGTAQAQTQGTTQAQAGGTATAANPRALATRAQQLLARLSSATAQLSTGQSAQEQQARKTLAQLQGQFSSLAAQAEQRLPAGSPSRTAIAQTARLAGKAAKELRYMTISPTTKQRLAHMQGTLNSLSSEITGVRGSLKPSSVSAMAKLTQSLATLRLQLAGTGAGG